MSKIQSILLVALAAVGAAHAQAPTGTIAGVATDSNGAAVAGARVIITNQASGLSRNLTTSAEGDYGAPALPSGVYQIKAEASGFTLLERSATVEAGTTTTVNLVLQAGGVSEKIVVQDVSPLIHYEQYQVGGVVSRMQIENLPLNGRSVLELAKLEPGVTAPTRGSDNRTFVPVLGSPGGQNGTRTRVTVDGGSVMQVFNGASAIGLSQEAVQEFQLTSINFDLATGETASGAINIVTRSGGNDLHGGAFYFFRDHNLAAYPALQRDPTNLDPFFQRRQFGLYLGGPIRRDRLFFFANWERNDQRGVVSVQPRTSEFVQFGQIAPSPFLGTQLSARFDLRVSEKNYFFARYSHDGSDAFAPSTSTTGTNPPGLASNWGRLTAWADQGLAALTSTLRPTVVNDFRFSYFFISSNDAAGQQQNCPGCIGLGSPDIRVPDASIILGRSLSIQNLGRRYHLADSVSWQISPHRLQFGFEYEYNRLGRAQKGDEPVSITLFSPAEVSKRPDIGIRLPSSFNTVEDLLQLPVKSFTVGIGNPVPVQRDFGPARTNSSWRLYWQDSWRLRPRLTVVYGLGWFYDPHPNRDLSKPAYLEPILGEKGLRPVRVDRNNFSPSLGFAWAATRDGRTVIRGGGGIYYDTLSISSFAEERASLGPRGTGRTSFLKNFNNPTLLTGAQVMAMLPQLQADLSRKRGDPNNRDFSVRNIEADKLGSLSAPDLATPYATHLSLGMQREIARDLVVSADFVYRLFIHNPVLADYNHFFSARGPVIPRCVDAQSDDPKELCSSGSINVLTSIGRARYKGLLVRAEKRFSRHTQFLASYAYSSNVGYNGGTLGFSVFNNDDWFESYGPIERDLHHILNFSGVIELPWRLQLSFNSSYYSKLPFTASVGNMDFNGDGTNGDVLPGTNVNRFNRGLGKGDLRRLVEQFNQTRAGTSTPLNQPIREITLPAAYEFGDTYVTQDVRVSRSFIFHDRYKLTLIGELFNIFNIANLSGYAGNLTNAETFGKPTRRFDQVFGSGGPRAFQLAARVSF